MITRAGAAAAIVTGALALTGPREAAAFCGFYVAGADSKLYNNATVVVMMRAGDRTALAMQNNYKGPPEAFALVVPVPVVLKKTDVKTLAPEVFARVDALTAPRLVEYWERDPCDPGLQGYGTGYGTGSDAGHGGRGQGRGQAVRVEAAFAVGEYDVEILGADDAVALEGWLTEHRYVIPAGAAEHLRPYVAAGSKFFVAKVDPTRVKFENGQAMLSPLRVVYPSEDLRLPIRLGLINAKGPQDLIVHVLADERQEVANYPNVLLPTEIVVKEAVREQFPRFYTALFDALIERTPGAVVTEYAWDARSCDPCPAEPLSSRELATLGMDALYDGAATLGAPEVRLSPPVVEGELSKLMALRISRAHIEEIRHCFQQLVLAKPQHNGGAARVDFTVSERGKVTEATYAAGPTDGIDECLVGTIKRWTFPSGAAPSRLQLPISLTRTGRGDGGPRTFVLTRLHARYDATTLGEDLVFRAATPIANGSSGGQGPFKQTPEAGPINQFQGRYIIQHPWAGEVRCEQPMRGVWGGPPGGEKQKVVAVENAAFAPRGPLDVAGLAAGPIVALGGEAAAPVTPPVVVTEPTAVIAPAAMPAEAGGCGCRGEVVTMPWALVLVPLLRRRQVQARSQSVPLLRRRQVQARSQSVPR